MQALTCGDDHRTGAGSVPPRAGKEGDRHGVCQITPGSRDRRRTGAGARRHRLRHRQRQEERQGELPRVRRIREVPGPRRQEGDDLLVDPGHRGRPPRSVLEAVRGLHRHRYRPRGQRRVRGPAGCPGRRRQRPRPGLHPAAGSAQAVRRLGQDQGGRRRHQGVGRAELHPRLAEVQHRGRQALRRSAGLQREVLRVVLAEDLQGEGLDRPDHLGRAHRAERQDRGERHQAVVRGHRVR
jgi:hypothetical protein